MRHRVLIIGMWQIIFLFTVTKYDRDGIVACLRDIDAPDWAIRRSLNMIDSGESNSGFTFANSDLKRILVVVGPTTSGEEFTNTLVHELHHVAVSIADGLGIDLESESPAYISGNAAMELADLICELGCRRCHKKH